MDMRVVGVAPSGQSAPQGFRPVRSKEELTPRISTRSASRNLARALTKNLLRTYHTCNPSFAYETESNPRRVLTKPSKPAHNDGYDNEDWDYILYVNDIIGTQERQQYQILDILGQGTFGQVVKCMNLKTKDIVAVKVIKNKPAYYNQSLVEVAILEMLNNQYDSSDKHHIVRMKDTFVFRNHLCIIFEMLSVNLYELIKQNGFRGLSTNLVRVFVSQILDCLGVLVRSKIIHCDLKPENILLKNLESPTIKVIDYGSACHENQTVYTYIQSRFYRSPEVLLGLPYTSSIDMWSLGCIAAELFLGLPLFPGSSEYNQVSRIVEMLGVPPAYMIEKGKQAHHFFEKSHIGADGKPVYRLKSMEQYMRENNCTEQPSKRYFQGTTLDEVISSYPVTRKGLSAREVEKEMANRVAFTDFLKGLLRLNPLERWSPQQARMHPFITGEKHTGPFTPNPSKRAAQEAPEAGAPRGLRPRANTISSSQIDRQNVPPQLQKLVALSSTTSGPERQRGSKGEAEPVSEKEKEEYTQQQKALARGKSADSHRRLKHEHPPAVIVGEDVSMDSPGGAAPPPERDEALAQAEDFMRSADAGDDDMDMDTDAVEEGVSQGLQKIMDGLTFKNNGGGSGVADDMDADVAKDGPVLCDGVLDHRTFGDAVRICETSDQDDDDFFVADKEPCDDEMDMPIALSDARYTPLLPEACDLGVLLENNCGSLSHGASLLPRAGRDRPPSRASPLG